MIMLFLGHYYSIITVQIIYIQLGKKFIIGLRLRGHNFALPVFRYQLAKNSFINRSLYWYVSFFNI